ncbi:MAG TPA: hypothetical protein VMM16_13270 [Verrucomicrobiae bacterium]|nr:hypothetical protein [Verrucomicrobiae bacterium]
MKLNKLLKLLSALSVGFVMGAMAVHAPVIAATSRQADGLVHVFIVPVMMPTTKTAFPSNLPGGRVAGISCIPKPQSNLPDAAICYVATSLN